MPRVKGTVKVPDGIEWTIDDFLSLPDVWYESPQFSFHAASWVLRIYVHPARDKKDREIDLHLQRIASGPPIHLEYSFSVKTRDGNKYRETHCRENVFLRGVFFAGPIPLDSQRMSELVPNGTLTVLCHMQRNADAANEISRVEENNACATKSEVPEASEPSSSEKTDDFKTKTSGEDCKSSCHLHKTKVLRDFRELFLNKEDCDVVIKVKGQEFPAHKSILKARSPVFASTFRCDMKEKATGIVDVEDCDPSSFSDFLCYLYCGTVENLSEQNVFSLFAAADKYDVQDLRAECLQFMKENLSVDTFCDTLTLALRHSETELIQLTIDFFIKNAPKIIVTVKWQNFSADNPTESNELFIKLLVPNKN